MPIRLYCAVLCLFLPIFAFGAPLKPYTLAGTETGSVAEVETQLTGALTQQGFEVVGAYAPMEDEHLTVICVTHPTLKEAVAEAGGLRGFASVLRVGLHQVDDQVQVAFTTPAYWGNAYFQKKYEPVAEMFDQLDADLQAAMAGLDDTAMEPFGSKKGLTPKKLRAYHYKVMMPYLDDVEVLNREITYADAVEQIPAAAGENLVYAVTYPEQEMALFGIALTGQDGEAKFLPKIDFKEPRHTPFLPYEMLVVDNRVVMLHGKYRIALSFPDLSMGTFMKIMSTPGDIADAMKDLATP